jgi:hypothetical protein
VGTSSTNTVTLPLIERWNGSVWAMQRAPSTSTAGLDGVSCSTATDCVAVMSNDSTHMAMDWNGTAWRLQSTRTPPGSYKAGLTAVSCSPPGACVAVGDDSGTDAQNATLAETFS